MLLSAHANCGLRRDGIVEAVFSDLGTGRALAALNTGLWRIKALIAGHDGIEIETIDDIVRLNLSPPARIDTLELARAVAAANAAGDRMLDEARRRALCASVDAHRGEFLEGYSDHWALPFRERYAAIVIEALTLLMRDAAETGAVERALCYGREILALDPFREGTQCEVMWLYMKNRQRVQAIRQFRQLETLLRDELGIEPMAETRAVYDRILGGTPTEVAPVARQPRPVEARGKH